MISGSLMLSSLTFDAKPSVNKPTIAGFIRFFQANQGDAIPQPPQKPWHHFSGEGFRDNETWLLGPMDLDPADWRWQEIEEGPHGGGGDRSRGSGDGDIGLCGFRRFQDVTYTYYTILHIVNVGIIYIQRLKEIHNM